MLSQKRANSVASFFSLMGIPKQKIKSIGYGENMPIFDNDSEENRAKNRRVEIRIIK
jgi:outer membrane protein OmpA-like peptidoglycan-associated protein